MPYHVKRTNLEGWDIAGEQYVSFIDCETAVEFYLPELTFLGLTPQCLWQCCPKEISIQATRGC